MAVYYSPPHVNNSLESEEPQQLNHGMLLHFGLFGGGRRENKLTQMTMKTKRKKAVSICACVVWLIADQEVWICVERDSLQPRALPRVCVCQAFSHNLAVIVKLFLQTLKKIFTLPLTCFPIYSPKPLKRFAFHVFLFEQL